MNNLLVKKVIPLLLLLAFEAADLKAQAYHCDTLKLSVCFQQDVSSIEPEFKNNGTRLCEFQSSLKRLTADSTAIIRQFSIYTSTSPEGTVAYNQILSDARAESIRRCLTEELGVDARMIQFESLGEDWPRLRYLLESMISPPHWVARALEIIDAYSDEKTDDIEVPLKKLDNGKAWAYMNEHFFPELRSAGGVVTCIIHRPVKEIINHTDTVFISQRDTVYVPYQVANVQVDTVFVDSGDIPRKKVKDFSGRKFLFAARTNILAIPLANVGIEIPLGKHWSMGVDYYYPWIWRDNVHKSCYELLALDMELRYWFKNRKAPENRRLTGHSIGLYATGGYYDYQWNWSGHQGEFLNAGVDYLFACPVARGGMHMEFEIGFGYIYSEAQPYDCFKPGDKCYRRTGVKKYIHWAGPTRAQISLVIPIYGKKKEVKDEKN